MKVRYQADARSPITFYVSRFSLFLRPRTTIVPTIAAGTANGPTTTTSQISMSPSVRSRLPSVLVAASTVFPGAQATGVGVGVGVGVGRRAPPLPPPILKTPR